MDNFFDLSLRLRIEFQSLTSIILRACSISVSVCMYWSEVYMCNNAFYSVQLWLKIISWEEKKRTLHNVRVWGVEKKTWKILKVNEKEVDSPSAYFIINNSKLFLTHDTDIMSMTSCTWYDIMYIRDIMHMVLISCTYMISYTWYWYHVHNMISWTWYHIT